VTERVDILVIGAGMAGASLAAELADHASVMILEAEDQPGYHATGRSAAFWSETYGGPWVQPLTTASRAFLQEPDPGFHDRSFLTPRGALHLADASGAAALDRLMGDFADSTVELRPLGRLDLLQIVPALRPGWDRAVCEPSCADIDVAALHGAYLRQARRAGAVLRTGARVTAIKRSDRGWRVDIGSHTVESDVVVNAAGAWAEAVAGMAGVRPLGIRPYRRTMIQLAVDPPAPPDLPLVIDARERFYFKPEAGGRLWLSPHDETPCQACDSAPEEIDTALAIARFERAVDWPIRRVERRWAGLRTFAPDRRPVYGFAPESPGFFWCAGQGGFGIQTAPAAAKLAASLLLGHGPDRAIAGIDPAFYRPDRFGDAAAAGASIDLT
jgi:D-arginine dehydrogenase